MKLSEIIILYRNNHGLSQRQLASKCGLSTGYISLIEKEINPQTGKRMIPTLQVLNKLSAGMGMSLDELLSACDDMEVSLSEKSSWRDEWGFSEVEDFFPLSQHEKDVVIAYRANPSMQEAVDRLLQVPVDPVSNPKQA